MAKSSTTLINEKPYFSSKIHTGLLLKDCCVALETMKGNDTAAYTGLFRDEWETLAIFDYPQPNFLSMF